MRITRHCGPDVVAGRVGSAVNWKGIGNAVNWKSWKRGRFKGLDLDIVVGSDINSKQRRLEGLDPDVVEGR